MSHQCVNKSNGDTIAFWRRTIAIMKDGQLSVSRAYLNEAELILISALAIEGQFLSKAKDACSSLSRSTQSGALCNGGDAEPLSATKGPR